MVERVSGGYRSQTEGSRPLQTTAPRQRVSTQSGHPAGVSRPDGPLHRHDLESDEVAVRRGRPQKERRGPSSTGEPGGRLVMVRMVWFGTRNTSTSVPVSSVLISVTS